MEMVRLFSQLVLVPHSCYKFINSTYNCHSQPYDDRRASYHKLSSGFEIRELVIEQIHREIHLL